MTFVETKTHFKFIYCITVIRKKHRCGYSLDCSSGSNLRKTIPGYQAGIGDLMTVEKLTIKLPGLSGLSCEVNTCFAHGSLETLTNDRWTFDPRSELRNREHRGTIIHNHEYL